MMFEGPLINMLKSGLLRVLAAFMRSLLIVNPVTQ
jgi:hypothetical protein